MSEKKEKKKKSKARSIIEWTLTIVFGAFFVVAGIGQIDGMIHQKENYGQTLRFGWGSFVVMTSSMEPVYPVDSAIVTYKEDPKLIFERYQRNEIVDITFFNTGVYYEAPEGPGMEIYTECVTSPHTVFTHRVFYAKEYPSVAVGEGRYHFFVKGINAGGVDWKERQYQVFTEKEILGVVKVNSQFLGWTFRVMSSPWGLLIFLLVPASYLVIVSVLDIFKAMKEPEEPKSGSGGGNGGSGGANGEDPLAGLSEEQKKKLMDEMLSDMMKGDGK